ncbi:MAG: menaquinone biosynthesis family protein [Trueperaceae bacterium]
MHLSLGYSPCPNDCFIFYALAHGKVSTDIDWNISLEDVEALNQLARQNVLDVSKISYHAYAHLTKDYILLPAGGALGKGVGPLIVTKEKLESLSHKRVAIPGGLTTANLLLKLSQPDDINTVTLRYNEIMPAVAKGEVDAGLIIHESRFTYPHYGLQKFLDVGEWWESTTGHVLPLGGIIAKRSLGEATLQRINNALKESLEYAYAHPNETKPYVAKYAQEMSEAVRQKHIDLYVNAYSLDVGEAGKAAAQELFDKAAARGLILELQQPLFLNVEP